VKHTFFHVTADPVPSLRKSSSDSELHRRDANDADGKLMALLFKGGSRTVSVDESTEKGTSFGSDDGSASSSWIAPPGFWPMGHEEAHDVRFRAQSDFAGCSSSPPGVWRAGAHGGVSSVHPELLGCDLTTVMMRNIPNNISRAGLLELLDRHGFKGCYDFIYLPIDLKRQASLGYAFVNFVSTDILEKFWETFDGFSSWDGPSKKICQVSWSTPSQGLADHIERYRNSPLMHDTVPDEARPVLFEKGVRVNFPPPTKAIRPPRVRLPPKRQL
jgi:hypothetical protein